MKPKRRFRRGLPSPLEVIFYLLAVVAFCIINWALLKADNSERSNVIKPFENMIIEAMLHELTPVMKAGETKPASGVLNLGVSSEHSLKLETWMISLESFSYHDAEPELAVEDWMLDLSSWHVTYP